MLVTLVGMAPSALPCRTSALNKYNILPGSKICAFLQTAMANECSQKPGPAKPEAADYQTPEDREDNRLPKRRESHFVVNVTWHAINVIQL